MGEWGEFATWMKIRAEEGAEERKGPAEGVDITQFRVATEIGAASVNESDVKFNEAVSRSSTARGERV